MGQVKHESLAAALVAAQAQIKHVAKDGVYASEKARYNYASSEDVIDEARQALASNGLAFSQQSAEYVPGSAETKTPALVRLTYCLDHVSGQGRVISSETPVIPGLGRPDDKALAAAKTYDLGYTLRSLLLIPRGDGDDAVNKRRDHEPPKPAPAPAKKAAPKQTAEEKAALVSAQAQVAAAIESAKERGLKAEEVQAECKTFYAAHGGRAAVVASSELMGQLVVVLDDLGAKTEDGETPWKSK